MKSIIKVFVGLGLSGLLFVLITNIWVVSSTSDLIYAKDDLPKNDVALILGTSKGSSNNPNRFFVQRMNAAAELFASHKIKHLLVSGDNSSKYYNEPRDMLQALGDLDIPEKDISLDFAGFRTLDSVIRSKEVFGQDSITIVTQEFHCYRSLFIAKKSGLSAVAFSADDGGPIGLALAVREILARSFAVADLYIFKREPKFLGEEIQLDIR